MGRGGEGEGRGGRGEGSERSEGGGGSYSQAEGFVPHRISTLVSDVSSHLRISNLQRSKQTSAP